MALRDKPMRCEMASESVPSEVQGCDRQMTERHLKLLDETAETFTFQTFTDAKPRPSPDPLAAHRTGTVAELWDWLVSQNLKGAGIFVTVNETDGKGRKNENIVRIRAVWQENDGDGKALPIEPHIVIESSPGKSHSYLLCEGLSVDDHRLVMEVMVSEFGSDPNATGAARVLRLAGFYHQKITPHLVKIIQESGARNYTAEEIFAAFLQETKRGRDPLPSSNLAEEFVSAEQIAHLRSALNAIPAHERGTWIKMGCALRPLGDIGRSAWLDWSQTSPVWKPSDATTWESLRSDRTGFRAVFAEAARRRWRNPLSNAAQLSSDQNEEQSGLRAIDTGDLRFVSAQSTSFAIRPIVPAGLLTLLGAHGGTGKSMLALILAAHFAVSRPWGPFEVLGGRAAFVSLEDPGETVRWRLRQIADEYALDYRTLSENLRIVDGSNGDGVLVCEDVTQGARRLVETSNLAKLRQLVGGALFVVVDNASDAFDGNENDRRMVRAFVRKLAQIARENDAGMLLLAHVDKAAARYGSHGNAYSGSTAWNNSARSRLAMEDKDGRVELRHEKFNLGRRAESLMLNWTLSGVLVPTTEQASGANGMEKIVAASDAADLLRVFSAAEKAGTNIPAGRSGTSTTQAVLETFPELPKGLREAAGRKRFYGAIGWLLEHECVSSEVYRDASRHEKKRLVINSAAIARARSSPIPPANERAQIARPAVVCDGSETAAELPQTAASDEPSDE